MSRGTCGRELGPTRGSRHCGSVAAGTAASDTGWNWGVRWKRPDDGCGWMPGLLSRAAAPAHGAPPAVSRCGGRTGHHEVVRSGRDAPLGVFVRVCGEGEEGILTDRREAVNGEYVCFGGGPHFNTTGIELPSLTAGIGAYPELPSSAPFQPPRPASRYGGGWMGLAKAIWAPPPPPPAPPSSSGAAA
ncbi:hypothetical protein PLESTB_000024600 [Pleodorina starrii]|uniref:Uncharacterized protein n=1 Tax=Pleodorina starrii TaxID=330485 RepID=A0A9W6B8R3_9CHLO|nr:hypothetical protein PLESTM_001110000 [Pleodorina starrii]GLC47777.1 hypothetical protein PLESTB_000024600 [Pleodorina starrii]GLC70807.1 hypothetical protein PLESTF_001035200 [Pleodorina starrii]